MRCVYIAWYYIVSNDYGRASSIDIIQAIAAAITQYHENILGYAALKTCLKWIKPSFSYCKQILDTTLCSSINNSIVQCTQRMNQSLEVVSLITTAAMNWVTKVHTNIILIGLPLCKKNTVGPVSSYDAHK